MMLSPGRRSAWLPTIAAIALGVVLMTASAFAVTSSETAVAQEPPADRTITVSGEGSVAVMPDQARVNVGVVVTDDDVSTAFQDANRQMDAVLQAMRDLGIPEDRIQTTRFAINVERDRERDATTITGYTVQNFAQVTVTEIDQVPEVIAAAVDAGANDVGNVTFAVEDRKALIEDARELAFEDARQRAEQLASLAGVTLGAPVSIVEDFAPRPVPGEAVEDAAGAAPPIEPGQQAIRVALTVTYAIE